MEKRFDELIEEERMMVEEILYSSIVKHCRKEMIEENYYKYEVMLQNMKFETEMTDEEVKTSVKLTIDLIEELKRINNDGMNRDAFERMVAEKLINGESASKEIMQTLNIWAELKNDKISEIIGEIDEVRRVGGAWALFLANPMLISAIYAVYERLVDNFDDGDLYCQSGFFLLRAIMKMHARELDED